MSLANAHKFAEFIRKVNQKTFKTNKNNLNEVTKPSFPFFKLKHSLNYLLT